MRIYFDNTVFGDFLEGSQADERRVGESKARGLIEIVLSVLNIEEAMAAEAKGPDFFRRLIRLILHWSSPSLVLKPVDILLKDDIAGYARDGRPDSPFMSGEVLETILGQMNGFLMDRSSEVVVARLETTLKSYRQRDAFKATLDAVVPELREAAELQVNQGIRPTFDEFYLDGSEKVARALAKKCDALEDCASRGLNGLLKVRSVRALSGILLSNIYAFAFEGRQEGAIGDFKDIQHFTLASAAAEIFVTDDGSLSYRAQRVPMAGLTIWTRGQLLSTLPVA